MPNDAEGVRNRLIKHRALFAHARAAVCVVAPAPLCWRTWNGWAAGELPGHTALAFGGLLLVIGVALGVLQITASKTRFRPSNDESVTEGHFKDAGHQTDDR